MKKYISLFKIRFLNSLQYRAAALGGIATQFAWGFMFLLLYQAFYRSDPSSIPMPYPELASYIWLQQAFLLIFTTFIFENEIIELITKGGVAYEISRPINLYNMWLVRDMARRTSGALLRCFPIIIVTSFLPKPYRFNPPANLTAFFAFLISLILSIWLASTIVQIQYIFVFKTMSPSGVRAIALAVSELLSGALIPLPFFPDTLRRVLEVLPLGSLQDVTLRVYSGGIAGTDIIFRVGLQLFWCIALTALGRVLMKNQLKQAVVQGG